METKNLETLEFDRILSHLSSFSVSPLGNELVHQLQPIVDIQTIQQRLTEVTELRAIIDFDDPFPIHELQDIRPELKKTALKGNFLSPQELIKVNMTLTVFRRLYDYFKIRKEKYPHLSKIAAAIFTFAHIEKEITRCINNETYEILDNASPELRRIRKAIASQQQAVRKKMDALIVSLSQKKYLQESVITIREGRLVLMVKDEYRLHVKGIVHDQSATGATVFIEPMETLELNNQIRTLMSEEKREIEKILIGLCDLLREQLERIYQSLSAATQFDFIFAKAKFSSEINGSQVYINNRNFIDIIQGRHPLLLIRKGRPDKVIPLDLKIGDAIKTVVITGPNAGGKTVALKTVGLLSLMAGCGLHIPADPSSDICIFPNIYSVIGDQQSIENDLSTFSSHVEKLKKIIEAVTAHDLVIIDEIDAGTDPDEGAALAISILEKLTNIGCITLVTTHQSQLKAFAHETEHVENGSMEFDAETLQPTYHFRLGLPGSSYAFEIARRYGLSDEIIQRSRLIVGDDQNRLENLMMDIENKIVRYQQQLNEISIKQSQLDGLIKLYQQKAAELTEHEKQLKEKAIKESEAILKSANTAIEQAIKEIKEAQASREAIKEAKQLLQQERQKLLADQKKLEHKTSKETDRKPLTTTSIGQHVYWRSFNTMGKILSDIDASNRVLIDTGDIKIKVPLNELEEITSPEQRSSKVFVKYEAHEFSSTELDLRGMVVDEALTLVDKFIAEASTAGIKHIYLIHGKGTGALRKSIHIFLSHHALVHNKRLADWNQGGSGVTVVELK